MTGTNVIEQIKPNLRYAVLRTALSNFETPPYQLSSDKLATVIKQVEKEFEIQSKILASKEAMDVILPEESITRAFKEVIERYENTEDFATDLSKNDLTEKQFKDSLARELKVEIIMDRVASQSAKVTDVDVMIYYHMHSQKMKKPEVRKARHILITINDDIPENSREQALERAQNILEKLKKKPKKFADLAMKHSECPSAFKGGEMGDVTPGVLYKELEDVLFKLPEKQLSPIVESPLGFHILRCDEIQGAKTLSISEATPAIRNLLEERRKKICQKTWLSKLLTGENND